MASAQKLVLASQKLDTTKDVLAKMLAIHQLESHVRFPFHDRQ